MKLCASLWASIPILLCCSGAWAQSSLVGMSGEQLFKRFCASCHGEQGRGDGQVADAFKFEVPDLTLISRRQGGKFPADRIERIIDGRHLILSHGTRIMPVWGVEFAHAEIGNPDAERVNRLIIGRLLEHVRSIQRPNPEMGKER